MKIIVIGSRAYNRFVGRIEKNRGCNRLSPLKGACME